MLLWSPEGVESITQRTSTVSYSAALYVFREKRTPLPSMRFTPAGWWVFACMCRGLLLELGMHFITNSLLLFSVVLISELWDVAAVDAQTSAHMYQLCTYEQYQKDIGSAPDLIKFIPK